MVPVPNAPVRVLIASRSPAWSAGIAAFLPDPALDVDLAGTVEEALAGLATADHDLVVIDRALARALLAGVTAGLSPVRAREGALEALADALRGDEGEDAESLRPFVESARRRDAADALAHRAGARRAPAHAPAPHLQGDRPGTSASPGTRCAPTRSRSCASAASTPAATSSGPSRSPATPGRPPGGPRMIRRRLAPPAGLALLLAGGALLVRVVLMTLTDEGGRLRLAGHGRRLRARRDRPRGGRAPQDRLPAGGRGGGQARTRAAARVMGPADDGAVGRPAPSSRGRNRWSPRAALRGPGRAPG